MQIEGRIAGNGGTSEFYHILRVEKEGVCIRIDDANNLAFWIEVIIPWSELLDLQAGISNASLNPCREIPSPEMLPDELGGKPTGRKLRAELDYFARPQAMLRDEDLSLEEATEIWAGLDKSHWIQTSGDRNARPVFKEPPGKGGYINQFGVRVPNPCREIDTKGRDRDKIYRWMRPGDKHDEETLDRLNNLDEAKAMEELIIQQGVKFGRRSAQIRTIKPDQPPMKKFGKYTEGIEPAFTKQYTQPSEDAKALAVKLYGREGESYDDVVNRVAQTYNPPAKELPDASHHNSGGTSES